MTTPTIRLGAAGSLLLATTAACASLPNATATEAPAMQAATGLQTCNVAKDPLHPFVIQWPAEERARLEVAASRGPVIVHYSGCTLRVLASCHVRDAARYELVPTTPAEDQIELSTASDLYASLPLAAASLEGKLAQSGGLRLVYVAAGERVLAQSPTLLDGECANATHYVDAMVLGAFELQSRAERSGSAGARFAGASAGGGADTKRLLGGSAGDVATCKDRGLDAGASCQAVLQLDLRPLRPVGAAFVEPTMGPAIPELAVIPSLGQLLPVRAAGALQGLDVTLLERLEAARRADADATQSSRAKARAWDALAQHPGDNPYEVVAERRRDEWTHVADAQAHRTERVLRSCDRYETDRAKLARVCALDDAIVSAKDKASYQAQFESAYGPWKTDLAACDGKAALAVQAASRNARAGDDDGMVPIPGGTFAMGIAPGKTVYNGPQPGDATPVHEVAVAAFAMDVTEVTVAAYRRCVQAKACSAPLEPADQRCTWRSAEGQLPITCVDREQARSYCRWTGKRLPTEQEWEYAARPDGRTYPWGARPQIFDDIKTRVCWTRDAEQPCVVGSRPEGASPFGVLDLAGNVWEWTDSWYTADYTGQRVSTLAVTRGGSFSAPDPDMLRSAYRGAMDPARGVAWVGFRCVRS